MKLNKNWIKKNPWKKKRKKHNRELCENKKIDK
jgi:hypothetical protein